MALWIHNYAFGSTNALAAIMDLMHRDFKPYLDQFIVAFIDDISVYPKVREDHEKHLMIVLQISRERQLFLSLINVSLVGRSSLSR